MHDKKEYALEIYLEKVLLVGCNKSKKSELIDKTIILVDDDELKEYYKYF